MEVHTVNLPVPWGISRKDYLAVFSDALEKFAAKIKPQLVLLSAGFDTHREDDVLLVLKSYIFSFFLGSFSIEPSFFLNFIEVLLVQGIVLLDFFDIEVHSILQPLHSLNGIAQHRA